MTGQMPLLFNRSKYRDDFSEWLLANTHIWLAFVAKSDEVWSRGRRHFGARLVVEALRYESALAEVDGMFKIDNRFIPDLSRLYMDITGRDGFFETRVLPGSVRAA